MQLVREPFYDTLLVCQVGSSRSVVLLLEIDPSVGQLDWPVVVGLDRDGDQVVDGILASTVARALDSWAILAEQATWTIAGVDGGIERDTREGRRRGLW